MTHDSAVTWAPVNENKTLSISKLSLEGEGPFPPKDIESEQKNIMKCLTLKTTHNLLQRIKKYKYNISKIFISVSVSC